MNFVFYTLVDITETSVRFNKNDAAWLQQQNFLTFTQTLSLRVNTVNLKVETVKEDVSAFDFGTEYKGKQQVWKGSFGVEYEGGLTVDMLDDDFDFVPIINNLNETVKLGKNLFLTKDSKFKNLTFNCVD